MPANLTPQFHAARDKYHAAGTTEERIAALEEMYRTIPKHKGTDKMQADIKQRLARLRQESTKEKGGRQKPFWLIDRQGAGRILLIGPANSGKSTFISHVSNAHAESAPYPFTTQRPIPGMAPFRNINFQIIDMPPFVSGKPSWMIDLTRTADLIFIYLNLNSDDLLTELEDLIAELETSHINTVSPVASPAGERPEELADDDLFVDANARRAVIVANLRQSPETGDRLELLEEVCGLLGINLPVHPISALTGDGIQELFSAVFDYLEIVRVYTKAPGKKPNLNEPITVTRGTTLRELAYGIHKDFAENLRYARVWGGSTFDGQRVASDYELNDEDVVELHVRQ